MRESLVFVPKVADGNPAAAMAWAEGNDSDVIFLGATALPVRMFHNGISSDPEKALEYTADSEKRRQGVAAKIASACFFTELMTRLALSGGCRELILVQEHPLMVANAKLLGRLGVQKVTMLIPDVHPKQSAVDVANRLAEQAGDDITVGMSVWNKEAQEELLSNNPSFRVDLVDPWLLNLSPHLDKRQGNKVILKSSGSGMPSAWEDELSRYTVGNNSIWTPNSEPNLKARINGFYGALDQSTRIIIGYSSELVQVVEALHRAGNTDVRLVALPPRGDHERRNLWYGIKHDLIIGGLALSGVGAHHYGSPDITPCDPHEFRSQI